MSSKCEVCSKGMIYGRRISIARSKVSRRAKRVFKPNIKRVKVLVEGTPKVLNVCTRCLRSGKVKRV